MQSLGRVACSCLGQIADGNKEDVLNALWTLGEVLLCLTKLMAPFAPFFSEWVYLRLRKYIGAVDMNLAKYWTPSHVQTWLEAQQLAQYKDKFAENGIVGADLLDLSHEDLQSMGVTRCTDRKAVLRAVQQLAANQPFEHEPIQVNGQPVGARDSVHFQMLPQPKASVLVLVLSSLICAGGLLQRED